MELDFDASLQRLRDWLARARKSKWSPTPEAQKLLELAAHLERTAEVLEKAAAMLADPDLILLEAFVDGMVDAKGALPPTHGCDVDGNPLPRERRAGRFVSARTQSSVHADRLREIADEAREQAEALPNSRTRPEHEYAADVFVHLWYEAGKPMPTLYAADGAVIAFGSLISRDARTARWRLGAALDRFDPASSPPGLEKFLVWCE